VRGAVRDEAISVFGQRLLRSARTDTLTLCPAVGFCPIVLSQAAIFCGVLVLRCTPSTYGVPAYTAGSNSAPLSFRNVDSATCNVFQIRAVAFSTFLKRLAADELAFMESCHPRLFQFRLFSWRRNAGLGADRRLCGLRRNWGIRECHDQQLQPRQGLGNGPAGWRYSFSRTRALRAEPSRGRRLAPGYNLGYTRFP
jgi:hypothetical protein